MVFVAPAMMRLNTLVMYSLMMEFIICKGL